jgi:hypothetical protein
MFISGFVTLGALFFIGKLTSVNVFISSSLGFCVGLLIKNNFKWIK